MRLVFVLSTFMATCYSADAFVQSIANQRKPTSLGMSSVAVSPSDVTSRLEIQMNKFKSRNSQTKKISNNVSVEFVQQGKMFQTFFNVDSLHILSNSLKHIIGSKSRVSRRSHRSC